MTGSGSRLPSLGAALALATLASCSSPAPPRAITPSDVGVSVSPAADQAHKCITEKGWDVELTWDGGIEASSESIPQAQYDQYRADSDACWAMIDERIRSMTPDQIREAYTQELTTRDCLIELGYHVSEPPSEQAFVDAFFVDRWSAYAAAGFGGSALPDDEWRTVSRTCPQPSGGWGVE